MYKCILNVISIGLLIISMPANAYYSGEELQKDCSLYTLRSAGKLPNISGDDGIQIGRCMGFVQTLFETHAFVAQLAHGEEIEKGIKTPEQASLFKLPEKVTNEIKIDYFLHVLSKLKEINPEHLKLSASTLLITQLVLDFPVQKNS